MAKDGIKDRKFQGVLYPDSESYCCDDVLNILKSTFPEFAYILHDKDTDENGELKKPHIHWVGRLKAARYLAALADDLGIAENMIERCRSFDAFIRYLIHDGSTVKYYMNGVAFTPPSNWVKSTGNVNYISFYGSPGFTYSYYDELRISKGALYTENYTPASAPFDIPMALVLPSEKMEGAIAVKSAVAVNNVRLGGVRPSYPAQGDVYISLDADKKVTSCQQYQSGTWTECQGSVCDNDTWVDLSEYSFAGQVVNEDDFAEVIDKKEDPAAGTDANPEAEATSFTVHYYKEGTTDKVRRDTVYQNLAVGAAFTASAPTVKGYKALAASAEITVTADGEHIFYYSVDESTDPGGSDDDPSKPGFFDGLLSSVKSLVNVICGFVGGVVQSLLSGITGIISTLIDAFKAVLSLGGHFGDFLAAALGFVPREIIDLLIAGIAVSIALAIIKFIRG